MIKYNAVQNRYLYRVDDIDKILDIIQNGRFYSENYCTQENVSSIVKAVGEFMAHIEVVPVNVVLERQETETEAREYFGEEFISKFDQLITDLDRQETIVAIHGTREEVCPMICEEGLKYKSPSLSSTAAQQGMAWGQHEIHYDNYKSLLNWEHKNYKGLVILAIPYECLYKEGLWNKFQDTNLSSYGVQDYKIDPDFVVGYIDVTQKQIVLNPKYNRQHNYEGYVKDSELFKEKLDMDNNKIKKAMIESDARLNQELAYHQEKSEEEPKKEQFDISRIPFVIDDLAMTFNSIKMVFPEGMNEKRYKHFLKELSYGFNDVAEAVPFLKTNDQVRKENEQEFSVFNDDSKIINSEDQASVFEDFDWETQTDKHKFI